MAMKKSTRNILLGVGAVVVVGGVVYMATRKKEEPKKLVLSTVPARPTRQPVP